jgi:Protein of unknown function (DUF3575)
MMKKQILFCCISCFMLFNLTAQKQTIVKTNLLNLPIIPSIHVEQQITNSLSLQFNFHRGRLVFFNESNWLNTSLELKHYFNGKYEGQLRGLYLSLAPNFYNEIDSYTDVLGNSRNLGSLGAMGKVGGQFRLKDSRFYIDVGIGLLYNFYKIDNDLNEPNNVQMRANISAGYQLF